MAVLAVTKYETFIHIYNVTCKPDLTRRKIMLGIDWDGLEELKVKSWPTFRLAQETPSRSSFPPRNDNLVVISQTCGGHVGRHAAHEASIGSYPHHGSIG